MKRGVEPEIPVVLASPPKVRAYRKSIPTTWAPGTDRAVPGRAAVTGAANVATGSTPSTVLAGSATRRPPASIQSPWFGTVTISSTGPRWAYASWRVERSSVSPTTNEPVMIAAPSIAPTTTSAASRGRRTALRSASRRSTGRRIRT